MKYQWFYSVACSCLVMHEGVPEVFLHQWKLAKSPYDIYNIGETWNPNKQTINNHYCQQFLACLFWRKSQAIVIALSSLMSSLLLLLLLCKKTLM